MYHGCLGFSHPRGGVSGYYMSDFFGAVALKPVFSEITLAIASGVVFEGS